jgi:hypothetical protein
MPLYNKKKKKNACKTLLFGRNFVTNGQINIQMDRKYKMKLHVLTTIMSPPGRRFYLQKI